MRSHLLTLPLLTKFAIIMALVVGVPALSRRLRLPAAVGLLFAGLVIGPHGLDVLGEHRPIVDFLAEIGKLMLMFMAGLEVDLALFKGGQRQGADLRRPHYAGAADFGHRCRAVVWLSAGACHRHRIAARVAYAPRLADDRAALRNAF